MAPPVTDEKHFKVIGECYDHGVIDGEAFVLARSRSGNGRSPRRSLGFDETHIGSGPADKALS